MGRSLRLYAAEEAPTSFPSLAHRKPRWEEEGRRPAAERHPYRLKTDGLFTFEGDLPGRARQRDARVLRSRARPGQARAPRQGTWPLGMLHQNVTWRSSPSPRQRPCQGPACATCGTSSCLHARTSQRIAAAPPWKTSAISSSTKQGEASRDARTSITTDNLGSGALRAARLERCRP